VRNSGLTAVVEAVGDHGCEYMTGGNVVILGPTGRNFAAGMSGGVAYVLNDKGDFAERCNIEMVDLEPLADPEEATRVKALIERHRDLTGSNLADALLSDWPRHQAQFVKVYPKDYRRMQEAIRRATEAGLSGDDALRAAFEENARDLARVGGN
jgi:glutamate synthase (ferredoxin)